MSRVVRRDAVGFEVSITTLLPNHASAVSDAPQWYLGRQSRDSYDHISDILPTQKLLSFKEGEVKGENWEAVAPSI